MKNITAFALFTLVTFVNDLSAQLKPEVENDWFQSQSLGPVIDEKSIKWQFTGIVKKGNLLSIEGFEINDKSRVLRFKQKGKITEGEISITGAALNERDSAWLFEKGPSNLFFSIHLKAADNSLKTLNIPLNFSARSKETLRTVIEQRSGLKREIKEVPYTRNLDGRRWSIGNSGEDANQILIEMVPAGSTINKWRELFSISILKNVRAADQKKIVDKIREGLGQNCPSLDFKVIAESAQEITYEWHHEGCNGYEASSEISRMVASASYTTVFRFAYKPGQMPPALRSVYLGVLQNEQ